MDKLAIIETVRGQVSTLRLSGVSSFTVQDIQDAEEALTGVRPKEIDNALVQLWDSGERIYQGGSGSDGTHLWCFGTQKRPDPKRRFIGR